MAKTAAERQKAYRQRRAQEAGELRINTWVNAQALRALNAMAERDGVTQKVLLERIILAAASAKPGKSPRPATQPAARPEKTTQPASRKAGNSVQTRKPAAPAKATSKPGKQAKPDKPRMPRQPAKAPAQASLWDDF